MGVFMHNIMHNILATVVVQTFCYFLSREAPRVSRPPGPDAPTRLSWWNDREWQRRRDHYFCLEALLLISFITTLARVSVAYCSCSDFFNWA